MTPKRLSMVHNFAALLSTQAVGRIIRFLYLIAIARFLAPEDVGIFSYGIALYLGFLGFAQFGQGALLATRVGRRRHQFNTIAAHSLTILLAAQAVAVVLALVFLHLSETEPHHLSALSLFVVALIGRGLSDWVRRCFVGLEQATWIPRFEFAFRGAEAAIGTTLLAFGGGLVTVCGLHAAVWGVEAVAAFTLLARRTSFRFRLGDQRRRLRAYAAVSIMFMLNVALLSTYAQVGIISLRLLQPDTATVAFFAVGMQFLTTLLMAPVSLSQAFLPGLSRAHRDRSAADLAAVATAVKLCMVGGLFTAIAAHPFGPWLVVLLFGQAYDLSGQAFAGLCWGLGPYAAAFVATQSLNGLNERRWAVLTGLVMVGLHVGTMVALIGFIGPHLAATIGLLVSACVGASLAARVLELRLGLGGHGWWLKPLATTGCVGVVTTGLPLPPWLTAGVGLVLALALLWKLKVFGLAEIGDLFRRAGLATLGERLGFGTRLP